MFLRSHNMATNMLACTPHQFRDARFSDFISPADTLDNLYIMAIKANEQV